MSLSLAVEAHQQDRGVVVAAAVAYVSTLAEVASPCLSPSDVPSSAKPLRVSFRSLSPFGLAPFIYYGTSR